MTQINNNSKWDKTKIQDISGKKIIVTGANSGLGFEATKIFASNGAEVYMACRNLEKAKKSREDITEGLENGSLKVRELDLADLESVRNFAEKYREDEEELHVLCNNAGVMAIPRQETEDGFEKQLGVNHLGHFALTVHMLDILERTQGETRVVNQSSAIHEKGEIIFEDLMMEAEYDKWSAYAQSKLANILFTYELGRRLEESGKEIKATAVHPGFAATNLQYRGPREEDSTTKYVLMIIANKLIAQSAEKGSLPLVYAATSTDIGGSEYVGPDGFKNMRGYPVIQDSAPQSYREKKARKLWDESEKLTGVKFNIR